MTSTQVQRLLAHLDGQREHVLGILDGLDETELRRPVLPTGWSCLSLVNHLSRDVEEFWFQGVVAGVAAAQGGPDDPGGWALSPTVAAGAVLDGYRSAVAESNRIIAATAADTGPAWWPEYFPHRHADIVDTMLHVLTETATHAGHLDAARELLDGRTWLVV